MKNFLSTSPTIPINNINAILHGGRKEIHAGNNGLGQSAIVRNTWLTPIMTSYAHGKGANAFFGGIFDGQDIWLVPYGSADLVKVNPATGGMTSYAHGKGASAFFGGIFDGQNIWLVPYGSTDLVKVNPATGGMTSYAHGKGAGAFTGGVFDGQNIWLVPRLSADLVKVRSQEFGRVGSQPAVSAYSSGAVYSLTATPALITFGGTSPLVVIPYRGIWRIRGKCRLQYNGATFVANRTVTIKLRRTNNTAADLTNGTDIGITDIVAALTGDGGLYDIDVIYSTELDNDQIELWGDVSVVPSAGSFDVVTASIVADRYDDRLS